MKTFFLLRKSYLPDNGPNIVCYAQYQPGPGSQMLHIWCPSVLRYISYPRRLIFRLFISRRPRYIFALALLLVTDQNDGRIWCGSVSRQSVGVLSGSHQVSYATEPFGIFDRLHFHTLVLKFLLPRQDFHQNSWYPPINLRFLLKLLNLFTWVGKAIVTALKIRFNFHPTKRRWNNFQLTKIIVMGKKNSTKMEVYEIYSFKIVDWFFL